MYVQIHTHAVIINIYTFKKCIINTNSSDFLYIFYFRHPRLNALLRLCRYIRFKVTHA